MPKLNMIIPHQLSPDEALKRIKEMLTKIKTEHPDKMNDIKEQWNGYLGECSFTAQSFLFSGKITVEADQVILDADLPFIAMPFKTKIEETIRQQAQQLLQK